MLLKTLSPEILLQIIDYIGLHRRNPFLRETSDLKSLSFCSRKFNILVRPIILETLCSSQSLSKVVHRLITKTPTDVSAGVGSFVTEWLDQDRGDEYADPMLSMSLFSEANFTACEEIIREICPSQEKAATWIDKLRSGHYDALAGPTLALLPNLEYFEFRRDYIQDPAETFISYVPERAARLQDEGRLDERGSLAKLRTVMVWWQGDEGGLSLNSVIPFVSPKSVRHVILMSVDTEQITLRDEVFHAEELSIKHSAVEGDCLIPFLHSFPDLKRFTYETGGATVGYSKFLPHKIGQAISHLKQCLEFLDVTDPDESFFWQSLDMWDKFPLGSLADFERLRELIVDSRTLLGEQQWALDEERARGGGQIGNQSAVPRERNLVDVIPKSLRKLLLEACQGKELLQLRELVAKRNEVAPELTYVRLNYKRNEPNADEIEPVIAESQAVGIELVSGHFWMK